MTVFILPTSGKAGYRGKYPNRARMVSGSSDSGLHVELNSGARLWSFNNRDGDIFCREAKGDYSEALARAVPMTPEQYEILREAGRVLATRSQFNGRGPRERITAEARALYSSIQAEQPATVESEAPATPDNLNPAAYELRHRMGRIDVWHGGAIANGGTAWGFDNKSSARQWIADHIDSIKAESEAPAVRRDNVEYHAGRDAWAANATKESNPYPADGERAARWNLGWQEACDSSAPVAPKEVRTIDLTPTWEAALPVFIAAIENGTPEGRRMALEELLNMARLADNRNILAKRLEGVREDVEAFAAVKQIRAHAAEENARLKRNALATIRGEND